MNQPNASKIWLGLLSGDLDRLEIVRVDGRLDLRGLQAPEPSVIRQSVTNRSAISQLSDLVEIRGVNWKGIDFSRSNLPSLRFFDSAIEDCVFDGAACQDWRMWGTRVVDTSFRKADLRKSALGAVDGLKRNSFVRADFSAADLRQTAYQTAEMIECKFAQSKLSKVDFNGTVFVNCVFTGVLEEVIFGRTSGNRELPPNEMKHVDFRQAKLRWVEFRELDMSDVVWPENDENVVIENYKSALDDVLQLLRSRSDPSSKGVFGMLQHARKWAGGGQRIGLVNTRDLADVGSSELTEEILRVLRRQ